MGKKRIAISFLLLLLFTSCGTVQSLSAIHDAEKAREDVLNQIAAVVKDSSFIVSDAEGRRTLAKNSAGEVAYYFYSADAYLVKAKDLYSRGALEQSAECARNSVEFSKKVADSVNKLSKKSVDTSLQQGSSDVKSVKENGNENTGK